MKHNILFLCSKNSARSQMAEVLLNSRAGDRMTAYSAGSHPADAIHPMAYGVLAGAGFDMTGQRTKSMDEYQDVDFDFIITLCDSMKEACPVFQGQPIYAHWGMPDPAEFQGTDEEKLRFFQKTLLQISQRVNLFLGLPFDKLDRRAMELKVKEIGQM